jgi:predicted extracellular nuclease
VIVAGDLNDFEYSDPIGVLEAGGLRALIWDVEKENRYTYTYLGYSQVLDHILITPSLEDAYSEVFIVHFNLDFPFPLYRDDTSLGLCSSDHDAIVAGFRI